MTKGIIYFIVIILGVSGFFISAFVKFNDTFSMMTKHTQLSAWALAQLEIETLEFINELNIFLIKKDSSRSELNLRYDILWSRYETFLTSDETKDIRSLYDSERVVINAFNSLKKYENAILTGNMDNLSRLSDELDSMTPEIRNLMIANFTGESSIQKLAVLEENKSSVVFNLMVIMIIIIFLTYKLYRDARAQEFIAWYDPLTKLKNRNYLLKNIDEYRDSNVEHTIILLDIDNFKEINDAIGYDYGDQVLITLSSLLKKYKKSKNIECVRIGADEFSIVITKSDVNLETYAKLLLDDLNYLISKLDPSKRTKISMGIANSLDTTSINESLTGFSSTTLNNADVALNIAKKSKLDKLIFFKKEIAIEHRKKRRLSEDLFALLKRDQQSEIYMLYQPIILRDKQRLGCEALIRWNHPTFGFIHPEYLIKIAEESGLAKRLGQWIMQQVYIALDKQWVEFNTRLEVAINLSDSLFDEDLILAVKRIFAKDRNYLKSIILEITETMTLDDINRSQRIIESLSELEVRLSLDDFGTGWSSLSTLNQLNFNKLKIDKSFVREIATQENQQYFVSSIVTLSHQLGIKVVAEGVEQQEQWLKLVELGVDEFQGYHFAKPIDAEQFLVFCTAYFDIEPLSRQTLS
ncbi:bifunctional diguanylate cyclase/phosphodiesterase [Vibrio sp. S234-5]|uniref:putative bifunctional diguanylate cyclase/phosphodiesterase n=1 Tax=Vibrio sp. S234-5 TaxID=1616781 RepID=UPI0005EFB1CC|nr:bifunctional diguanylate cyclase/phosphodiesterase [Vibrio sp. S234-5]KJR39885.1 diguanylate cyclase [Vibrio sp. S234-5]